MTASIYGLDVGISTTDAVAGRDPSAVVSLPTGDPVETAERALRTLLDRFPPAGAARVAVTGVGSHGLGARLLGLPVEHVSEFAAIGAGGARLCGRTDALVVSLGTGTALVSVTGGRSVPVVPGTGVGGGTLLGLARALLGIDDPAALAALAARGDRTRLDVTIGEAAGGPLGPLPATATAANFAKRSAGAAPEDVAASLVNLVAEVVLTTALLGLQVSGHDRAILVGKLLLVTPVRARAVEAAAGLGRLFEIPERGEVATALGAAWCAADGESG